MEAYAIELRGAPFFGWIHDLTAHDPYFVTPIFMGANYAGGIVVTKRGTATVSGAELVAAIAGDGGPA